MNKKNMIKITKTILLALIVVIVILEGHRQVEQIDFANTIYLTRSFKKPTIFLFFLLGMVGTAMMTLYDYIIIDYMKLEIKKMAIFNVSFIANTINNISGLGGLTGASIRAIFLKKDIDNKGEMERYGLLLLPATGVGLSVMSVITLINYHYIAPIIQEHKWLLVTLVAFIIYLIFYFYLDKCYYWAKQNPNKDNKADLFL